MTVVGHCFMHKQSIKLKIKSLYRDLSKKEAAIADFILNDPKSVSRMTISEIATSLGFADSTVFQFTRKLGYKGFRDFRNDLLTEEFDPEISIHENIKQGDTCLNMSRKVFDSSILSLQNTCSLLEEEKLKKAVDIILASKMLTFFGVGGSNVVAYDAYHKFLRSPLHCQYATDYHIQLMQASLLDENDCAVIITHTGLTKEALQIAETAKKNTASKSVTTASAKNTIKPAAGSVGSVASRKNAHSQNQVMAAKNKAASANKAGSVNGVPLKKRNGRTEEYEGDFLLDMVFDDDNK